MPNSHRPPRGAKSPASTHLDWSDAEAVRRWHALARTAQKDLRAVVLDMLRPPRRRSLGPVQHRALSREAMGTLAELLKHAAP
jgi:hypothetical protein